MKMADKNGVEWSIRVDDGSSEVLEAEYKSRVKRVWAGLKGLVVSFVMRVWRFFKKAWDLGFNEPRKFFHCLKVGVALTVVSLFYYLRPLNDGVGGNAIWAVMTVVVVFEYTVGGTLYKSVNRICATSLAGFLALGVHSLASQSGHQFEPFIMGISLFILASATTFSRFIPQVKAHFDYGCTIFILTYSLVSISGFRVEKLLEVAHERTSTIIIGTCLCIVTGMLVCPVWAGMELHLLIPSNMDKLASSLDSCVAEYFDDSDEESKKKLQSYKCVLNSKASEESMANFAKWEPAHGQFNFRHPWKNYLMIGTSTRSCAYCIETLTSCLGSKDKVPESIKNHLNSACFNLSSASSNVIREMATTVTAMTRSTKVGLMIEEMKSAVQELQNDLKTLPSLLVPVTPEGPDHEKPELVPTAITGMPLMEVLPVVSFASLLIEIASRVEGIVKAVEELAQSAEFKLTDDQDEKTPTQNPSTGKIFPNEGSPIAIQNV